MLEVFALYSQLNPLWQGLLLFPAGLAFGSFSTVICHRLPQGQSIVSPRSHCPHCQHDLGVLDLIPLFSYLWLRGRCRYCRAPFSWRYPLLELGCGLLVAGAGAAAGWFGALTALLVWLAGAAGFALRKRWFRQLRRCEGGLSLVEVLMALFIMTMALVPALDTIAVARQAGLAGQRRSLVIGLAQARISQITSDLTINGITAYDGTPATTLTGEQLTGDPRLADYEVSATVSNGSDPNSRRVSVTVSCDQCRGRYGTPVPPVTVESTVRKG